MRVLLSIRPEFASKIFDGSKRYEYRRVIFKRKDVNRVIVYASSPIKKVIGEFEIDSILSDEPANLWNKTKNHAGISKQLFFDYFSNTNNGHAIRVKNCTVYETPMCLETDMGVSPPQSFMYVD